MTRPRWSAYDENRCPNPSSHCSIRLAAAMAADALTLKVDSLKDEARHLIEAESRLTGKVHKGSTSSILQVFLCIVLLYLAVCEPFEGLQGDMQVMLVFKALSVLQAAADSSAGVLDLAQQLMDKAESLYDLYKTSKKHTGPLSSATTAADVKVYSTLLPLRSGKHQPVVLSPDSGPGAQQADRSTPKGGRHRHHME